MAITTNDPRNPKISTPNGFREVVYGVLEANSQGFYAGELVYLNSGAATACATSGTSIYGIALKDATSVTSGNIEIPIMPIYPHDELLIQVGAAGTVKAASNCTPGTAYGLTVSSNHHTVNTTDTTNDAFVFAGEVLDGDGSSSYWGRFHLLDTVAQAVSA